MWTVELVRGPLDNRKYTHISRNRAEWQASVLAELHGVNIKDVVISEEAKEILIDATDWYIK